LGEWSVRKSKADTQVELTRVEAGDTIDFITDCGKTVDSDSFGWEASIEFEPRAAGSASETRAKRWDTRKDFTEATLPERKPLTDWHKYGQVLLLANELVFVD